MTTAGSKARQANAQWRAVTITHVQFEARSVVARSVTARTGSEDSHVDDHATPKRRAVPDIASTPVVSLVGLDPLSDIDMSEPQNRTPSFYKMRLGKDDADVPVTFTNKAAEACWTGIFGQAGVDQLFIQRGIS